MLLAKIQEYRQFEDDMSAIYKPALLEHVFLVGLGLV